MPLLKGIQKTVKALRRAMVVTACLISSVHADGQAGDRLLADGEQRTIYTTPLEEFLESHPKLRPRPEIISSGQTRGYIASWSVIEGCLYLEDIETLHQIEADSLDAELRTVMDTVFPGQARVMAAWYTGHVVIPIGELLEYVHVDFARTHERYSVLTIVEGCITNTKDMTKEAFAEFRKDQFRLYRETQAYERAKSSLLDVADNDEKVVDNFLFNAAVSEYTSMLFAEPL